MLQLWAFGWIFSSSTMRGGHWDSQLFHGKRWCFFPTSQKHFLKEPYMHRLRIKCGPNPLHNYEVGKGISDPECEVFPVPGFLTCIWTYFLESPIPRNPLRKVVVSVHLHWLQSPLESLTETRMCPLLRLHQTPPGRDHPCTKGDATHLGWLLHCCSEGMKYLSFLN